MSSKIAKNDDIITKKCGEITITIKKNAKNVFSFNCWFCDTICAQLKKFTLHLEREHVEELEKTTPVILPEFCNPDELDDKIDVQKEPVVDSLFLAEIKIEDCVTEDIKTEVGEEIPQNVTRSRNKEQLPQKYDDPLETVECNGNDISMAEQEENETDMKLKNEIQFDDAEMDNISEYEHSEDDSDYDGAYLPSTKTSLKPNKSDKKAKEKELILALIEEYRNKPELWSISSEKKLTSKEKDEILKNIAVELNEKFDTKLKLYTVKTKLNNICKQYEEVIRKQISVDDNEKIDDNESSDLWYYEQLSFLKPTVENKIKNQVIKPDHEVKPLDDSILSEIIEIYKKYDCLWDVNHIAYLVNEKRSENMNLLLEEIIKTINVPLNVEELENNLKYIHSLFSKDKKLKIECEAKQEEFQPSCSLFNKCKFLETNEAPFTCSCCSKIFKVYDNLRIHKAKHDGSNPYTCQKCGKTFNSRGSYLVHVKRHLKVFNFICKICDKGYPVNSELEIHMRQHTGALPYLCSLCGERFRTTITYDNHIRRHEERFRYNCHICKRGFNVMTFLKDHVRAHLNVRNFVCNICDKSFTSKKYLNYHLNIHGSKKYTCKVCGKSFAQDAGLRRHKKIHLDPTGISKLIQNS
ncbi:uncharacterized protein ACRADG_008851 [Cochliomyia hominivorax]